MVLKMKDQKTVWYIVLYYYYKYIITINIKLCKLKKICAMSDEDFGLQSSVKVSSLKTNQLAKYSG